MSRYAVATPLTLQALQAALAEVAKAPESMVPRAPEKRKPIRRKTLPEHFERDDTSSSRRIACVPTAVEH